MYITCGIAHLEDGGIRQFPRRHLTHRHLHFTGDHSVLPFIYVVLPKERVKIRGWKVPGITTPLPVLPPVANIISKQWQKGQSLCPA